MAEDFSWDAIWNSAGRIEEFGYAVEVAIPFNQLRFAAGDYHNHAAGMDGFLRLGRKDRVIFQYLRYDRTLFMKIGYAWIM